MTPAWQGKIALVTGASSGIGAAVARRFAREGLHVILVARRAEKLLALVNEIEQRGGSASLIVADLVQEAARLELWQRLDEIYPGRTPDVLVNNAGFAYYGYTDVMPWKAARDMVEVNAVAMVHLTRMFLPGMLARRSGRIINIGSVNGVMPSQGTAVYSASKAFVNAFTAALYRELRGSGVEVSVVLSGPVATELFDVSETIKNGFRVPAERGAISPGTVAACAWSLLLKPRRYVFVPWYWRWVSVAEFTLGWAMDLVGPALLKRQPR